MNSKALQAALAFALLTTIHITSQACTLPVEAVITNPDPSWYQVGQTACFDGSDSRPIGGLFQWKWDFGDGTSTPVTGGSPPDCVYPPRIEHSYSTVNEYHPELWVKGVYGDEDSKSFTLYVIDISLTADSTYVCGDLVPIHLSIETPKPDDKARLLVTPTDYPDESNPWAASIKIWRNPDKTGLIIPDNGKYWSEWSAGYFATPKTYYVERASSCDPAYPRVTFAYVGVYPNGAERTNVGPSPYVDFTVCCPCTPGSSDGRDHVFADKQIDDLVGARAYIEARYVNNYLCCQPYATQSTFVGAWVSVSNHNIFGSSWWAQTGYVKRRNLGSTTAYCALYCEVMGDYWRLKEKAEYAPAEKSYYTYQCDLELDEGWWWFTYGTEVWNVIGDPYWKNRTGRHVGCSGEVMHRENDMPGTPADKCLFTSIEYCKNGESYEYVQLTESDLDSTDESKWDYELGWEGGDSFYVWDKYPDCP